MAVVVTRVGGDWKVLAGGNIVESGEEKKLTPGEVFALWQVLRWIDHGSRLEIRQSR